MEHRLIEELSLNQWPALSTLLYDGWLLRYAEGYTKRANSINPLFEGSSDLEEKIEACERIYRNKDLPTIYKMTPFTHPANLDFVLAQKNYLLEDAGIVQAMCLSGLNEPISSNVKIEECVTGEWIEHFCRLSRTDRKHSYTMHRMLSTMHTKSGFISLYENEQVVAVGLGVIERGYIGLYNIVTDAERRKQGFGEQMILNLLQWGKDNGATHSFLLVLLNNIPALRLYEKLGFRELYPFWFRVKSSST